MAETNTARRTSVIAGARPAVVAAAVGSAVAGLIHATAAGNHQGDTFLVWMFAACAAAQLGWGWAVITAARPSRSLLLTGLVINGGAILVWAASRTTGIAFISSLRVREEVGTQDLTCVLFTAVSVAAIVCILVRPDLRAALPAGWPAAMAVCAFLLAVPALAATHTHPALAHDHVTAGGEAAVAGHNHGNATDSPDSSDSADATHNHGAGAIAASTTAHDHSSTAVGDTPDAHDHSVDTTATTTAAHNHGATTTTDESAAAHDHSSETDSTESSSPHDHSTTTTTVPGEHNHDPGSGPTPDPGPPITSLDDPRLTPDQVQRAVSLIVATMNGMSGYVTEADVLAAGYQSIGDGGQPGQYEHFIKWSYLGDGFELDAGHIESIVMKMNADGTKRVVAAMYALTWGDTLADVPDIAGGLTLWHDHDNMCFVGDQFVGLTISGVCPVGTLRDTPPMLDVWIEDNPCGPFAVIDNEAHACATTGHTH
jgi:hypothetical protein